MSDEKLEFSVTKEWQKARTENPWLAFVPESAQDSEGNNYLRKPGSVVIYEKTGSGYKCTTCDSEVLAGTVAHSIHDGPWEGSGYGRVRNEEVPYCPKCEEKPKFHGTPIRVPFFR